MHIGISNIIIGGIKSHIKRFTARVNNLKQLVGIFLSETCEVVFIASVEIYVIFYENMNRCRYCIKLQ